jgi:hypothetical protein
MSYLLSLGGVACTTKTTILRQLQLENSNIVVHLDDYKELHDRYKFDHEIGSLLFSAYRNKQDEKFKEDIYNVHIFDRHPMESLVYNSLHNKFDLLASRKMFNFGVTMGLHDSWKSIVLQTSDSCEERIVDMMKRRDNKIDTYNAEYVREQNDRFDIWSTVVGATQIYVDYTDDYDDITKKQESIRKSIMEKIYNWKYFDGLIVYEFKLPILKNKIACLKFKTIILASINPNLYANMIKKFEFLIKNNFTIVILYNHDSPDTIKHVVEGFCFAIGLPMIVMIAVGNNEYKLPMFGTMHWLIGQQPLLDLTESYFYANIFDDDDYMFADECKMRFFDELRFLNNSSPLYCNEDFVRFRQ